MRNLFTEVLYGCFVLTLVGGVWAVGLSQAMTPNDDVRFLPGDADLAQKLASLPPGEVSADEELGDIIVDY